MTPPHHPSGDYPDDYQRPGSQQQHDSGAVGRVRVPSNRPSEDDRDDRRPDDRDYRQGRDPRDQRDPRDPRDPRGHRDDREPYGGDPYSDQGRSQQSGSGRARVPGMRVEAPGPGEYQGPGSGHNQSPGSGHNQAYPPQDPGYGAPRARASVPIPRPPAEPPQDPRYADQGYRDQGYREQGRPEYRDDPASPAGRANSMNYLPPQSYLVPEGQRDSGGQQGYNQGPPPGQVPPRQQAGAAGRARVGAFTDTGTFHALTLPPERVDLQMDPEAARRRVEITGSFRKLSQYDYERFSTLSGKIEDPPQGEYKVKYRKLPERRPLRTVLVVVLAFVLEFAFFAWLIAVGGLPDSKGNLALHIAAIFLVVSTIAIEAFRFINVVSLSVVSLTARNPIPVWPQRELRVAFITTIVPGKEPIEMVEMTLKDARKIRHPGKYDVWLLDEGDDPEVKAMCQRLGVNHFTRRNVPQWNTAQGPHKARTKHGNYNAWIIQHGSAYDVFVSVDPDHAPMPSYCERMLGYFRDPDVAFVIGPQVYGNYEGVVTKSAESQQYLFHAMVQRAGNRFGAPMLVGTNNAMRISALMEVNGLQDSITEDMATGLLLHGKKNPATGRKWKSVYTPDVLAVGEGPSSWTDFFTQQHRWSRGTHEVLAQMNYPAIMARLGLRRMSYYQLLMAYYPLTALAWILGAVNAVLFLVLGVEGVQIPPELWLMLYADASVLQTVLYLWNRRHNVSPHEPAGSSGLAGMLISILCAPVYVSSFMGALLHQRSSFVITPKGQSANADRLLTFRKNIQWAIFYIALLVAGVLFGHFHSAMWFWCCLKVAICVAPIVLWRADLPFQKRRDKRRHDAMSASSSPMREMEPAA
jgi:cellulose synthase/poly-beta-1,6-N-acetylglucosamine synthase-like glycosyltransferase